MLKQSLFVRLKASTANQDELEAQLSQAFERWTVQVTPYVQEGSSSPIAYARVCFESCEEMIQAKEVTLKILYTSLPCIAKKL